MLDQMQDRLDAGLRNLLVNCGECSPGQSVLIVHETCHDGYYDPALVDDLMRAARELGLKADSIGVAFRPDVTDPDTALAARMEAADCTVFLARLGDQIRFRSKHASMRQIISYALDRDMLASAFGTVSHGALDRLKTLIDSAIAAAGEVHVTCPEGTDVRGRAIGFCAAGGDVTRKRFPVSVFAPVPAVGFRGRVAQTGFLTGTGSNYYAPYACELKDTLFVDFDGARITGFSGSAADRAAAQAHYDRVGAQFGIDAYHMHSWHAGIHPGCRYADPAGQNFERWSGGAFGNPRLLHFHTCGDYPPGEISLNVLDPTVRLDGVAVWEDGRLHPDRLAGAEGLLADHPDLEAAFRSPASEVGQSAAGRLAYR